MAEEVPKSGTFKNLSFLRKMAEMRTIEEQMERGKG
jgi:hypothetical protein